MMDAERRTMVMTEQEKMLTAYHEGGHAIVACARRGHAADQTRLRDGDALGLVRRSQTLIMEIHQIIHFIAIVETGSFTIGADRAAVSQSAISASISKLEAEFGVQLLDRRRSPVVPTDARERLLEAGKAILQICNTVKANSKRSLGRSF
jgi:Bacterial regulatory helix-turn-helix protein, lysR family